MQAAEAPLRGRLNLEERHAAKTLHQFSCFFLVRTAAAGLNAGQQELRGAKATHGLVKEPDHLQVPVPPEPYMSYGQ